METKKIPLTTICARLERAIHADVGMRGLDILIFGWARKQGRNLNAALYKRRDVDGYMWLSDAELAEFSKYAGYNLTKD